MPDISELLNAAERGDPQAAAQLLPVVYDELRRLALVKIGHELPGQTLDATGLVHEAYLRMIGSPNEQRFESRRHFVAAAAEAMRRILIDRARHKRCAKRGGGHVRVDFDSEVAALPDDEDVISLDEGIFKLTAVDPLAAELVKLRYFAGLTIAQAALALDLSPRTTDRIWAFARAWLYRELQGG